MFKSKIEILKDCHENLDFYQDQILNLIIIIMGEPWYHYVHHEHIVELGFEDWDVLLSDWAHWNNEINFDGTPNRLDLNVEPNTFQKVINYVEN